MKRGNGFEIHVAECNNRAKQLCLQTDSIFRRWNQVNNQRNHGCFSQSGNALEGQINVFHI